MSEVREPVLVKDPVVVKEWKRNVPEKVFFTQDFAQGEIFLADGYFYSDDVIYYAQERGLNIERLIEDRVPAELKDKLSKWLAYRVLTTRFQLPGYSRTKPIATSVADIL